MFPFIIKRQNQKKKKHDQTDDSFIFQTENAQNCVYTEVINYIPTGQYIPVNVLRVHCTRIYPFVYIHFQAVKCEKVIKTFSAVRDVDITTTSSFNNIIPSHSRGVKKDNFSLRIPSYIHTLTRVVYKIDRRLYKTRR